MTYREYMKTAETCRTAHDAQRLIDQAADDTTISARQYHNIRYTAIKSAYQIKTGGKNNGN